MGGEGLGDYIGGAYRWIKDKVTGLPPLPEVQPECQHWNNLPKTNLDGVTYYYIDSAEGEPEDKWFPESSVKVWFYEDQVRVVEEKINQANTNIDPFRKEIEKIQGYLHGEDRKATFGEMGEARLRIKIERMQEELNSLSRKGLTPNDVEYRRRAAQIKLLMGNLSNKTPATEDNSHIADWAIYPGGPIQRAQDLYVLMNNHRSVIDQFERSNLKPLEIQLDRNNSYLNYWRGKNEEEEEDEDEEDE